MRAILFWPTTEEHPAIFLYGLPRATELDPVFRHLCPYISSRLIIDGGNRKPYVWIAHQINPSANHTQPKIFAWPGRLTQMAKQNRKPPAGKRTSEIRRRSPLGRKK